MIVDTENPQVSNKELLKSLNEFSKSVYKIQLCFYLLAITNQKMKF